MAIASLLLLPICVGTECWGGTKKFDEWGTLGLPKATCKMYMDEIWYARALIIMLVLFIMSNAYLTEHACVFLVDEMIEFLCYPPQTLCKYKGVG